MKKKCLLLLLLLLLFTLSCVSNRQTQPFNDRLFESLIQEINDPTWEDLSLWPQIIKKGNFEYQIKINGCSQSDDESVNIKNSNCIAQYELTTEARNYKNEDLHFGPFFVWRPDGSIRYKSMADEQSNWIAIDYYENEITAKVTIYYYEIDLESIEYFSKNNSLLGYSIVQYENSLDRTVKKVYFWKDQFLSENDFNKKKCVFNQKLRQQ